MKSKVTGFLVFSLLLACQPSESQDLKKTGSVTGSIVSLAGIEADAWLFLNEPTASAGSIPKFVTAVSRARAPVDSHFVFAHVPAGEFDLTGLLDVDKNFDGTIDVFSQVTRGDRRSEKVSLTVQPGRGAQVDVAFPTLVQRDPPSFRLEGDETEITIDPTVNTLTSFVIVSDSIEKRFQTGFEFSLIDDNADNRPDDVNGDNIPDLSLQFLLLWKPKPGQAENNSRLVIPLVFDATGLLRNLNGELSQKVVLDRIALAVFPQAQLIDIAGKSMNVGQPPPGEYALLALDHGGQFWQIPNALSSMPEQQVRFHIDRR